DAFPGFVESGEVLVGGASWYGPGFHGRKTANGERFDTHAMTAAHKTLPFGTYLAVTNPENDKTVLVRVNDRGPYIRGRIIDLSYAAAKAIDMIKKGTAEVVAKVLWPQPDEQDLPRSADLSDKRASLPPAETVIGQTLVSTSGY
ncbi:MAG: septal ring lytic transglycosylase RlpA family protein, partial [Deltaproteobacteria bacterium]|nr:septal ring lytic transglycosylase RlpA family protein [Deltaproteobacteria bacterium]